MFLMLSSSNVPGESSFILQYMPSLARSGVILNPTFPVLEAEREFQISKACSVPPDFHKAASGLLSEDSLEEDFEEQSLDADATVRNFGSKGELFMYNDPRLHQEDLAMGPGPAEDAGLDSPLLRKLEQLKEFQQQRQAELKQQQLEQLQKLMEEQKMLLNMVSRQQAYSGKYTLSMAGVRNVGPPDIWNCLFHDVSTKTGGKTLTKRPFLKKGEGLARFKNGNEKPKDQTSSQNKVLEANNGDKVEKLPTQRKTVNLEHTSENGSRALKWSNQPGRGKSEQTQKISALKLHNPKNTSSNGTQRNQRTIPGQNGKNSVRCDKIRVLKINKENVEKNPQPVADNKEIQKTSTKNEAEGPASNRKGELSFEVSFQKRQVVWEKSKQTENYELDEFLLLEEAAEDISFSSNSSFVQKLLDPHYQIDHSRLSSTPVKQQGKVYNSDAIVEKLGQSKGEKDMACGLKTNLVLSSVPQELEKTDDIIESARGEQRNSRSEQTKSDHRWFSSEEYKGTVRANNEDSGIVKSSREADPESEDCKVLFRNVKRDTKSRDFDLDLSDGETSDGEESTLLENKSKLASPDADSSLSSSDTSQIEFDDEKTWTDLDMENRQEFCENNFSSKEFIPSAYTTRSPTRGSDKTIKRKVASKKGDEKLHTNVSVVCQSPPPTSDLMIKLFPSLKPKQKPDSQPASKSAPVQEDPGDAIRSQLLREKLIELENEIERFKIENASLARLREDKEKTLESLRKEVAEFDQHKMKELAQIDEMKKDEMKKLQKERKVFEKYANAARAIPDKKEREEIQALKVQLKDLQEELKRKEAKWSNTQIRLRKQTETLLKENGELREEINFMEKVRVESWKKAEAAESKKKTVESGNSQRPSESTVRVEIVRISNLILLWMGSQCRDSKQRPPALGSEWLPPSRYLFHLFLILHKVIERILKNGCHVILFPNGTRKEVSADGKTTTVTFFNGDVKQVMADQRVIYYYADAQTTHTTYPDGLEILQFSNGQIERHFPDGKKEITFPDQTIKNLNTDGTEESIFPDGTIITINPDGSKLIAFDNGQQELHTPQFKRREYPDGTVKTVYSNGQQETKYASGRVRVKDQDGNVITDNKM
uniref:Centromere protein J n=1 Tax=Leptobrachium leishanense TaxID=445787 RepID=A0A8C5LXX2_9ANUR